MAVKTLTPLDLAYRTVRARSVFLDSVALSLFLSYIFLLQIARVSYVASSVFKR